MIKAVRGAISVDQNDHRAMEEAVSRLVGSIREKNGIAESDIISLIFTQTSDLNIANPAAALRKTGAYASIPLFCTSEPEYEGSLPLMLRVLITYNSEKEKPAVPLYLGKAAELRSDLKDGNED